MGVEIEKYLRLESVNDLLLRLLSTSDSENNCRVIVFHFLNYCTLKLGPNLLKNGSPVGVTVTALVKHLKICCNEKIKNTANNDPPRRM